VRRLRERRGLPARPGEPLTGAATVDEVVREAFEHLAKGPTRIVGEMVREGMMILGGMERNDAVQVMIRASAGTTGKDDPLP